MKSTKKEGDRFNLYFLSEKMDCVSVRCLHKHTLWMQTFAFFVSTRYVYKPVRTSVLDLLFRGRSVFRMVLLINSRAGLVARGAKAAF